MKLFRLIAVLAAAASVSACATVETATRNVPLEAQKLQLAPAAVTVQAVRVSVPRSLRVSEANLYYPLGDIVWREDPLGDRHAQVQAIVEAGLKQGLQDMPQTGVPVLLDVEVTRFHALTEKARYTVGGVHSVQFKLSLLNPETGIAYTEPRLVKANLKAFGGARAINAERNGITQKLRITNHIAEVIRAELANPEALMLAQAG